MSRSFAADYKFGTKKELERLPFLNEKFNTCFIKTPKYASIDFVSGNTRVEQKSRTNAYKQYDTTLLPYSKVKTIKDNENVYFLFVFTDGDYILKYDKDKFSNYEVKPFVRNKRIDYNDKLQDYFHIPITELTPFNDFQI
jgi:hypothetical protein